MKTQRSKTPPPVVPDLKSATQAALSTVADYVESLNIDTLFGTRARRTPAEYAVLEEARKLAIAYVRKGVQG